MSAPDDLYPPTQYGGLWLLLAFGIIVLLVIAAILLVVLTRPKKVADAIADDPETQLTLPEVVARLQGDYLRQIDAIERGYRERTLPPREANVQLSRLVRRYVNEYSGLEAPVLSLQDLQRLGVNPSLIDALRRHYYPSIFRSGPPVDPVAGAEAARTVVRSWR